MAELKFGDRLNKVLEKGSDKPYDYCFSCVNMVTKPGGKNHCSALSKYFNPCFVRSLASKRAEEQASK